MVSLVVWDEPCLGETLNQAFISLYAKKSGDYYLYVAVNSLRLNHDKAQESNASHLLLSCEALILFHNIIV